MSLYTLNAEDDYNPEADRVIDVSSFKLDGKPIGYFWVYGDSGLMGKPNGYNSVQAFETWQEGLADARAEVPRIIEREGAQDWHSR